jgi:hypothetical protein
LEEILTALKEQVTASGLVKTAHMLGHTNTQNISRWIRQGRIPSSAVVGTKAILDKSKSSRSKRAKQ